jgi:preprotein translocase subunit SecF
VPIQIVPPDTKIDFLGKWKLAVAVSLLIIGAGLASALVQGVKWGIDFAGGTEVQVHFPEGTAVDEAAVRAIVASVGVTEPTVVRFAESGREEFQIRFAGQPEGDEKQGQVVDRIKQALAEQVGPVEVDRVEFVGPKVGEELRRDGTRAMLISWLLILAYVGLRFNLQFAPGGVVALVHDVLVTAAIWQLMGQAFDLQVLAALLAIVGYSINDTIVVYDRIRDNFRLMRRGSAEVIVNASVNQTLARTLVTGVTSLLVLFALMFLGGDTLWGFSVALIIGIVVGTYSSIYVASSMALALEVNQSDFIVTKQEKVDELP